MQATHTENHTMICEPLFVHHVPPPHHVKPSCGIILNTLPTCNAEGSPLLGFGLPLGLKPARWADDMRFPPTFRNPTEASLRPNSLEIWALLAF